jgi:malonyl-CoA O-methyltransferase
MASDTDLFRLDVRRVRRSFDRAASSYDASAVLQREVGQRMAERLALFKLDPETVVDAGCGTGAALGELASRYRQAFLIGLDVSYAMLGVARRRAAPAGLPERSLLSRLIGKQTFAREAPALVCADACRMPFATASVGLIWSNLLLDWINDAAAAFAEFHRVLRVGGLLMFTTFGPDTLKELRAAFAGVDGATHVNRFIDMHDLGDLLVRAGFGDPVMDMENMTLTYADTTAMMRDLKSIGAHNATTGRARGLMGRKRWSRVLARLETFRHDGRVPATFEVVYGHAWKPEPRFTADGRAIVRLEPRAR